jgi:excisionase family DNA binding protein
VTALALNAISYTVPNAAKATGIGRGRIIRACDEGDLPCHWNGTNRIIRAADLDEWIQSLPTERPKR